LDVPAQLNRLQSGGLDVLWSPLQVARRCGLLYRDDVLSPAAEPWQPVPLGGEPTCYELQAGSGVRLNDSGVRSLQGEVDGRPLILPD